MKFSFENWSLWIMNRKMSQVDKTKLSEFTFLDHPKHSLIQKLGLGLMGRDLLGGNNAVYHLFGDRVEQGGESTYPLG
jgi:hypothetical protein